jgi:hypothetical protein
MKVPEVRISKRRVLSWQKFLAVIVISASLAPEVTAAQEPTFAETRASPTLFADHWAVVAAKRAEALGLVDGYLPAQRNVPRHVVERVLHAAAIRAEESRPNLVGLTQAWRTRFAEEFRAADMISPQLPVRSLGNRVDAGYLRHEGRAAPGDRIFAPDLTGATALPERAEATGMLSLAVAATANLAALVEPEVGPSGLGWHGWDLTLAGRGIGISVGRQPVRYGYADSGGIVMSGAEPIDRIEVSTVEPFRLPSFLGRLGRISAHGFGSRLEEPRHPGNPYLWGMAGSLQPHPRITLSIHRASIIGGDSVATPLTLRTFGRTFIGHNLLGFENEVVAGQLRLRLPTERLIPLTLYWEWGAEDAAGAWRDVPGRLTGVIVPALPGLPEASLGVERVSFAVSCCGNPPWYRHAPHTGGWVNQQSPLGHPLGGQGSQTTVFSHLDLWQARLRFDGQWFSRRREGENLFVPGREGTSQGFAARAGLRLFSRSDALVSLTREAGKGWKEQSAYLGISAYF